MGNILLRHVKKISLYLTSPFSFENTVYKPSHFPISTSLYKSGKFIFATCFEGIPIGIELIDKGTIECPHIECGVYSQEDLDESFLEKVKREIIWRFDMDADLDKFNRMAEKDTLLSPVLGRRRGMRIMTTHSLYEYIIVVFLLQNATIRRTVQMMEVLIDHYGYKVEFNGTELSCIWHPTRLLCVDEQELRELKVGYRAKFIKRLSDEFCNRGINEQILRKCSKEDLKKKLLSLYGIGKQSVWYIMFEVFHFYDALETISPWKQKIYSRLIYKKELVDSEKIMKRATRTWGKWSILALHYLFEDLFWRRQGGEETWLDDLIKL